MNPDSKSLSSSVVSDCICRYFDNDIDFMITVGDFLKSFVKYANETPNALVYTDLAPWASGNSSYCYVKSLMLKDGAVLLDCINEDFMDN